MIPKAQIAHPDQTNAVANIIGRAFHDDPISNWTFGRGELFEKYVRLLMKNVYFQQGFVTHVGDQAASLWLYPGASDALPFFALMRLVLSSLPSAGFGPTIRGNQIAHTMDAVKPKDPMLYLFAIGVLPVAQGQGLGSVLMKDGLRHADENKVRAYLESSKEENIPIYQRHGFEVFKEAKPAAGAPSFWAMIREPRSS